jgi:hypothetical protein
VLVAEGRQRVERLVVHLVAQEHPARAAGGRVGVPGRGRNRVRHVPPGHEEHLIGVVVHERADVRPLLLGKARLDPEDHAPVLQAVHELLVPRRLPVDPVLGRDLVVAAGGRRVRLVLDPVVERRGVRGRSAALHAAQRAARRLGGRRHVEELLLGEAAAVGEHLGGLGVAAAFSAAPGGEQHQHDEHREGEHASGAVAHQPLPLLGGARLPLALLALTAERLLLLSAV